MWGFIVKTDSPRYPASNGLAERFVGTVKSLWSKDPNRDLALFTYRTTPLSAGYSPAALMFGRPVRSYLFYPRFLVVNYKQYESKISEMRDTMRDRENQKYRAKYLSNLREG